VCWQGQVKETRGGLVRRAVSGKARSVLDP